MLLRCCTSIFLIAIAVHAQSGRGVIGGIIGPVGPGQPQVRNPQGPPPKTDCAASGVVVNAITGEPIPRAMVTISSGGAATDAKGEWSVTSQTCGRWIPNATRPGFLNGFTTSGDAAPRSIEFISGTPVRGIKIALMPEASISGHVQDTNGDPIQGAQVMLLRAQVQNGFSALAINQGANTDQFGNFVIGRLQPGRYLVCAQSIQSTFPQGGGEALVFSDECYPGPASQGPSGAFPVQGGRDVRVSLTLRATPGLHVRGTVSGVPENQGLTVRLQKIQNEMGRAGMFAQLGPATARPGQVRRDGTFDIANVTPGAYIARAQIGPGRGSGGASAEQRIQVGGSDLEGIHLRLEPPGSLNGTVRYELTPTTAPVAPNSGTPNPNQNPVVNINLNPVTPGGGGAFGQIKWDEDRRGFSWPQVAAGDYLLNVNARQGYVKSATLQGQDVLTHPFTINGATGPIELVISNDTGAFNATVNDADGHPATATIILKPSAGQIITLRSGEDGVATRQGLPVGDYRAWAFDDISRVPWAEDDWMTQHAGASTNVTITKTGTGSIALKRLIAPPD